MRSSDFPVALTKVLTKNCSFCPITLVDDTKEELTGLI